MSATEYRSRIVDQRLRGLLHAFGAVCIEGPKHCGKTLTARKIAESAVILNDPDDPGRNRLLADISPETLLNGKFPRLIAEWQECPLLWDAVLKRVNKLREQGLFILTGSVLPGRKGLRDCGAGSIGMLRMRPMSLWESGDSDGKVSLEALCRGEFEAVVTGNVELDRLTRLMLRGGWPEAVAQNASEVHLYAREYVASVFNDDIDRHEDVHRDRSKLDMVLRALARVNNTAASPIAIQRVVKKYDGVEPARQTMATYLDLIDRLFLTDNLQQFTPSVQMPVLMKKTVRRHLCDPSLVAALLKIDSKSVLYNLDNLKSLFSCLCVRDLRIYAEAFGGKVFHYQDYRNQEMDAVIAMPGGSWAGFAITLSVSEIEAAARRLLKIQNDQKSADPNSSPSVVCVLCAMTNAAYRRPDGVFVVPITSLKS